jgi:L-seryl-tRNA(Ser) seleniumtransferase
LARDREVIVSRGELVEIGGSFRIPEIMEESRAVLRGVGTTNRTHLHDYERVLTDETAALLRVHTSNFRLIGFTKSVSTNELADLAHKHDLPLIYDLGSGCLSPQLAALLTDEPTVASAIEDGVDVICFSGDKLLGGPQAGIIVGKERYISAMREHPLLRTFRCDKMTLAALEHTLRLYFDDEMARRHIPILSMALVEPEELKRRTELFADKLKTHGIQATVEPSSMVMGGGTAPELYLDSWACVIDPALQEGALSPSVIDANLRASSRPVICRLVQDRLFFDLRTVRCDEEDLLIDNLMHAMKTECQS